MKKLLLALCLFLLPTAAQAGVPCSVPFNLTNGTPADATQVMANYNAILSCLSVSAAANGSNSDITALNGLTTPLTPTQAPGLALCGVTGFTAINDTGTPTTELDLAYVEAIATNALGAIQRGTSGALVLNAGTTGANGLDTGSLAASSNYYIWLISNGSTFASLLSLSSTAPTLPGGYTYQCRVGAWYTNTALHFITGQIKGRQFAITQKPGGSGSNLTAGQLQSSATLGTCGTFTTDTTVLTAFTGIPTTAAQVFGSIFAAGTSTFVSNVGPSTNVFNEIGTNTSGSVVAWSLVPPASQSIYVCNGGGGTVNILGWVDSVNAN